MSRTETPIWSLRTHRQSVGVAEAGSPVRRMGAGHSQDLDRTEVAAEGSIHLEAALKS